MDYSLVAKPSLTHRDCLVVGIHSDVESLDFIQHFSQKNQEIISKLIKKATKPGDLIWQAEIENHSLLVIQCGEKEKYTPKSLKKRIGELTDALLKQRITSATLCMPSLPGHGPDWQLEYMITEIDSLLYQILEFKQDKSKAHQLTHLDFYLPQATASSIDSAKAIAAGIELTRHLANRPANICTPSYLGEQALQLAKQHREIRCTVMGNKELKKMGMNLLLAVGQGSNEDSRLIDIHYQGAGKEAPIILVGKGITFDSGGLSIKPANAMDEMKYDMCGAATVLGTIKACALLKLPINIIGLIACAENLIGPDAVKPGDIITSMSGQTVEILNTDAEGRLVLADALTYAERYNPQFVIDIATLTGAIIVALGGVNTGFMTEDDKLATIIEHAAKISLDHVWRMPLDEAYQDALDSPIADMINSSFDRSAGSVVAACFLSRFTKKYRWAHLDVAGTAWSPGKKRNATGRPVPLLIQLIRHAAHSR